MILIQLSIPCDMSFPLTKGVMTTEQEKYNPRGFSMNILEGYQLRQKTQEGRKSFLKTLAMRFLEPYSSTKKLKFIYIQSTPPPQAGCDKTSISWQYKASCNWGFSSFLAVCLIKAKESSLPYLSPVAVRTDVDFPDYPQVKFDMK